MSGLCGWLGQDLAGTTIERMAAPICRFERTPLQSVTAGRAAVALSGSMDCTSLYAADGLIVALWGSPGQHAALLAQRWRSHGAWACASLAGQFAFAILDDKAGEALLAVDRFATRPLYYQLAGQNLVFATAQDALLRHPLAGRDTDPQALYAYLALGAMAGSAWLGQHQLAPGEYVHLRAGRLVRQQWWRMRFYEHSAPRTNLAAVLSAAMAPVQGSLAPGVMLDAASACAALAAPGGAKAPVPTYSVAYDAAPRTAGAPAGLHHTVVVTPPDLVDAIPALAAWSDQPCNDSRAVAAYFCALAARAHGTLHLASGVGAAALFGAGAHAVRQRRMARYLAVPAILRQVLVEPLLMRVRGGALLDDLRADLPARVLAASPFGPAAAPRMLDPALLAAIDTDAPLALLRQWWWSAQCKDAGNRAIALDLRLDLPAQLAAVRCGCALAGVDAGFPFLDPAVVDCASHTDPRLKHPGRSAPHARALRALAPAPLRQVRAGVLPFAAWLQTDADLRALAFDSLSDLRARRLVAGNVIDELLRDGGNPDGALVWQLMMLEQWFVYRAPHRAAGAQEAPAGTGPHCRVDDPLPLPVER